MSKLVEIVEGDSDFNECYYKITLLGFKVADYAGPRKDAMEWLEQRAKEIEGAGAARAQEVRLHGCRGA